MRMMLRMRRQGILKVSLFSFVIRLNSGDSKALLHTGRSGAGAGRPVAEVQVPTTTTTAASVSTPSITATISRICDSVEITNRVRELESKEKELLALKARINDLERKEHIGKVVTPSKSVGRSTQKQLSPEQQQIKLEVGCSMNTKVIRAVKFPKPGWSAYSETPGTVCAVIMNDVSLPYGITEGEKRKLWDGFIKKMLNRMLTQAKNRITQDLRKQFNGMPFLV